MFWISELKTNDDIHIPGYKYYRNNKRYANHGVIGLFVKYALVKDVKNVEFVGDDGIYVSFINIPSIIFSGWYVTPSDSIYASNDIFASISSKLSDEERSVILFGDFNAKIKNRNVFMKDKAYLYTDDNQPQNSYGDILQSIAEENDIIIVNGLIGENRKFDDSLTFKKKETWISRLDLMLCSYDIIPLIDTFKVIKEHHLPSDHAIISCSIKFTCNVNIKKTLERAVWLNEYDVCKLKNKRGITYDNIDTRTFKENLKNLTLPEINENTIESSLNFLAENLYRCAEQSLKSKERHWDMNTERWKRLIDSNEAKDIWLAINWKGELSNKENKVVPSPEEFKIHFENLLLTNTDNNLEDIETASSPYIPVLDDPIIMEEIVTCVNEIKPNKACDRNGNSPGFIKLFTPMILLFLLNLYNTIFQYTLIPIEWTVSKLITLFKRGKTTLCGNYRGIAINDIFFRLFDRIIGKRLQLWYRPCREQAGAQKGRDCIEHIMTIRLLIDHAKKSKLKLYILFIDFEKAYDKVKRSKLIELLKSAGCGKQMLEIIKAIYKNTTFLFKNISITTNLGVKQGSSTSCLLFILYVDKMIKMIKTSFVNDGFLGSLHTLMLMDDTVLFATSKDKLIKKFKKCQEFCEEYGMTINEIKTKFMVINKEEIDQEYIMSKNICVKYCDSYIYLGAPITDDGSYITMLNQHVKNKMKQVIKFYSFLNRNPDLPFPIKKQIAESCVFSSFLYGSETWFTENFGKAETLYMKIIKALLDVRNTTCNDTCLFEAAMSSLKAVIKQKMKKYLQVKIPTLENEDPLYKAIELNRSSNTKSLRVINRLLNDTSNVINEDRQIRAEMLKQSSSTKRVTYCSLNPTLKSHNIYKKDTIKEYKRIAFTRFRLSSHKLKVETGRWGRVPRENRTCTCLEGGIQDESHVVFICNRTRHLRIKYHIESHSLEDLYNDMTEENLCDLFYDLSRIFGDNN